MRELELWDEGHFTLRLIQRRLHSKQQESFVYEIDFLYIFLIYLVKDIPLETNQNNMNDINQQQSTDENANGYQ